MVTAVVAVVVASSYTRHPLEAHPSTRSFRVFLQGGISEISECVVAATELWDRAAELRRQRREREARRIGEDELYLE